MSNNPFKPPETDATRGRPSPGSSDSGGSRLKAVLTGLAVDIGGSTLAGIVLRIVYAAQVSSSDMTQQQMKAALENLPPQSPIAILGILVGALCSVAGGYVCARIVRRDELRAGAIMAAASGFLSLVSELGAEPDGLVLLLTLSTVACVMLGAKYGRERNLRRAPPADAPAP